MTPIQEIVAERQRQQRKEGFTHDHDDTHNSGALALAGAAYAISGSGSDTNFKHARMNWPFEPEWFKPQDGRQRNLVKAAALIVAEIERLDRRAVMEGQPHA